MTKTKTPTVYSKTFTVTNQVLRLVTTILIFGNLVACAVVPTERSESGPAPKEKSHGSLISAADMYNSRNYPGAIREYNYVITTEGESANNRRMAHLGQALVYLGNDENWHSIENAKISLMSASSVAPEGDEEFAVETNLLMDAISAVIGTESKYAVLMAKSDGSGTENTELRREIDSLKAERVELVAEQKVLNEALERLKELTLGE